MAAGLATVAAGALTLITLSPAALPVAFVLTSAAQLGTAVGLGLVVTLAGEVGYRGAFAAAAAAAIAVAACTRLRLGGPYTVGGAGRR
jgi:hypothetical protein